MSKIKSWKLHDSVTGVVQVMLEELISRKEKYEKMEKAKIRWSLFVLLCLAIFIFFGYDALTKSSMSLRTNLLSVLFENGQLLFLMIILAIGLIQVRFFDKKSKKAEIEYDMLREEFIDRTSELWNDDTQWKYREDVFNLMQTDYDINLFYK